MKKVGQPPSDLFNRADRWYQSVGNVRAFSQAIAQASSYSQSISEAERARFLRDLTRRADKCKESSKKLQVRLSEKLKDHFDKRGITVNSVIRLWYPDYTSTPVNGSFERAEALIKVVAFNYQPQDDKNPNPRFRVIGKVATGDNQFSEENRFFPLDRFCFFESVA